MRRPASRVTGPRFESRWEHSSFSLKSPDFVPVAPRVAFSGMGQARIENKLKHIYLKNGQVKIEGMWRSYIRCGTRRKSRIL